MPLKLHHLTGPYRRRPGRIGRGISAGQGKTAGRGTKGQKARAGYILPRRFEGGQISFIARLPKRRGFRSPYPKLPSVRIDRILQRVKGSRLSPKILFEAGLLTAQEVKSVTIKIVGTAKDMRPLKWSKRIRPSKALAAKLQPPKKIPDTPEL